MKRGVFVIGSGVELPHVEILRRSGHDIVGYFTPALSSAFPSSELWRVGQGICPREMWIDFDKIKSQLAKDKEDLCVFIGDLGYAGIGEWFRSRGVLTLGGNHQEIMEISRQTGLDYARNAGVLIPKTYTWNDRSKLDTAREFVRNRKGGVVLKSDWRGDFETRIFEDGDEAISVLEMACDSVSSHNPVYIQERVVGPEVGFDVLMLGESVSQVWWGFESLYGQAVHSAYPVEYLPHPVQEAYKALFRLLSGLGSYWGWMSVNFILTRKGPVFLEFVMRPGYIVSYLLSLASTDFCRGRYDTEGTSSVMEKLWIIGESVFEKNLWGDVVSPIEIDGDPFSVSADNYTADFYTHYETSDDGLSYRRIPFGIARVGVVVRTTNDLADWPDFDDTHIEGIRSDELLRREVEDHMEGIRELEEL